MAQTINKILLKRSDVIGHSPLVNSLTAGEIVVNTADGILFLKKKTNDNEYVVKFLNSEEHPYLYNSTLSSIKTQYGNNNVSQAYDIILGGVNNTIDGAGSSILNGETNKVSSDFSLILGGYTNEIKENANFSSIVGGSNNTILSAANYSAILGGTSNTANHESTYILGDNISTHSSFFVYVNNLSSTGDIYTGSRFLSGGVELLSLLQPTLNLAQEVYTVVKNTSADWNSVYSYTKGSSALELQARNFVNSNSSNLVNVSSIVNNTSANWNSGYSFYNSNSSTYAKTSYVDSKFLPNSGGLVTGQTTFNNNVTIYGVLSATGGTYFANTYYTTTSALSVVHVGDGPAFYVAQTGSGDIASFYDTDQGVEVLHIGGANGNFPNVGIKTSNPNVDFTVNGQISAKSNIWTSGSILSGGQELLSIIQPNINIGIETYTNIRGLTGNWNSIYSYTNNSSSFDLASRTFVNNNSANILNVNSRVNTTSANWNSVYNYVNNVSGLELQVRNFVNLNSSNLVNVSTTVNNTSANWNSVYSYTNNNSAFILASRTFVNNNSTNIIEVNTRVNNTSANWNSVYSYVNLNSTSNFSNTFVQNNSANILEVNTRVNNTSANWNSVYSSYQTNSAFDLTSKTFVNNNSANILEVNSRVNTTSANWNSVYSYVNLSSSTNITNTTFVQNNSSNILEVNTKVNTASANWDSVFTSVQNNSSEWNNINVTSYVNTNFIPISGGTITGNLSVLGNITYLDTSVGVTSSMYIETDSSVAALRITQKGIGDVVRIEDSDNPDSTPFIINNSGSVGIGTSSPNKELTVVGDVSATGVYYGDGSNLKGIIAGDTVATNLVRSNSGFWQTGYDHGTSYSINSSFYVNDTKLNSISSELVLYTEFNDYKTNVSFSTATLLPITVYQNASGDWQNTYSTVKDNSAKWVGGNEAYTNLISNSAYYLSSVNLNFLSVSGNWSSVYTTVNLNSATNWNYQGTDIKALSGNWVGGSEAYTNLVSNSAFYLSSVNLNFLSVSGNWNSVYSTVNLNSATTWNYQGTDLKILSGSWIGGNEAYGNLVANSAAYLNFVDLNFLSVSGNWNSVYSYINNISSDELQTRSFVNNNSSNTLEVNTIVNISSANWQTAYIYSTEYNSNSGSLGSTTLLSSVSSLLTPLTLTNLLTGQLLKNSDFSLYEANVAASTATLLPISIYENVSGNWQTTYTTVQTMSSNWGSEISVVLTNDPLKFVFIGDGTTMNYTISGTANSTNSSLIEVFVDNVRQEPSLSYTLSSEIVTFTSSPSLSSRIVMITPNATAGQLSVAKRHEFVEEDNYSISYAAIAPFGTLENNFLWRITKIIYTDMGSISSTQYANNVAWSDRLIVSYI